jgi:membrane-associated HD superfamily phosphohydrolase
MDGYQTDGYLTATLPGFASNLTFISLSRSVQSTFEWHPDPSTISRLGKLVWLVLICVIGLLHYRNRSPESDATENRLLTGVCLMLVTDYFLPIRIEYADVMFLIPMALLMPVLIRQEHRIFAMIGIFAMLIHQIPMNGLPFNTAAVTSMMRSGVVLYLLVRFTIVQQPETSLDHKPASSDPESTSTGF